MAKIKKRKKRTRIRGARTIGYGFRKKHKGKGSKGGKGMAGTGKRAGHKIGYIQKYFPDYFGKRGFKSLKKLKFEEKTANLDEIEENLDKLIKRGGAKEGEIIEIKLPEYKILGRGNIKKKVHIYALKFSKQAIEKIKKVGGKAIALKKEEKSKQSDK